MKKGSPERKTDQNPKDDTQNRTPNYHNPGHASCPQRGGPLPALRKRAYHQRQDRIRLFGMEKRMYFPRTAGNLFISHVLAYRTAPTQEFCKKIFHPSGRMVSLS